MSDDELLDVAKIEELAKKMCESNRDIYEHDKVGYLNLARIARDHFAAKQQNPPAMDEGRRREAIRKFCEWGISIGWADKAMAKAEEILVSWGLIPPAKVTSIGERFAYSVSFKANAPALIELAKLVDDVFGPLINLMEKCVAQKTHVGDLAVIAGDVKDKLDAKLRGAE